MTKLQALLVLGVSVLSAAIALMDVADASTAVREIFK